MKLLALTGMLAAAAAVHEAAASVTIHIKVHHHKGSPSRLQAKALSTGSGSGGAAAPSVGAESDPSKWHMTPVRSVQARVQGSAPSWDEATQTWVAGFGKTYAEKQRAVLDTVNTASVEGALMYVQAEGINAREQSNKCERKNKMQYIEFYELEIVQPTPSVAYYTSKHSTPEYCPFVAMDGGKCTDQGSDIPPECKQFDGIGGEPKLGHCVGANKVETDPRAPYPGNYWFSFPNSCVTKGWKDKTDECRAENSGGLCAPGEKPDGVKCTFSYKTLGYLNIDDLVGITDGSAIKEKKPFKNFTEFCLAGHVEFDAENTGSGFKVETTIPFWEKPNDETANRGRTEQMIKKYNELAPKAKVGKMQPLPDLTELTAKNPKCYLNTKECATAEFGCRRTLYAQLCQVCSKAEPGCEKAPADFKFPELEVPKPPKEDRDGSDDGSGTSGNAGDRDNSGKTPSATPKNAAAGTAAYSAAAAVASTLLAAALL
ncbi:hypothetical protein ATCC90586_005921 [Pythium insidiosum]|nr:hypothetical protein ATCC90586_005921 [Pythium insidiosum]